MIRLREPISAGETGMMLLGGVLVGVAVAAVAHHWLALSLGQWLLMGVALEFVVLPVSTLLHELGHAAAVVRLGARPAHVIVGRGPWMNLVVGRLRVSFSLLRTGGVQIRGVCRYEASGLSWRSLGWIALAGPAATLSVLALLIALVPAAWSAGPFARMLLVLSAVAQIASLIANLSKLLSTLPLRVGYDRGAVANNDGAKARRAFARHREGAPPLRLPTPTEAKAPKNPSRPVIPYRPAP